VSTVRTFTEKLEDNLEQLEDRLQLMISDNKYWIKKQGDATQMILADIGIFNTKFEAFNEKWESELSRFPKITDMKKQMGMLGDFFLLKFRELDEAKLCLQDLITYQKIYQPIASQLQIAENITEIAEEENERFLRF